MDCLCLKKDTPKKYFITHAACLLLFSTMKLNKIESKKWFKGFTSSHSFTGCQAKIWCEKRIFYPG